MYLQRMEAVRKAKGVTKTHIAKKCGHTTAWYSDLIKQRRSIRVEDLVRIAEILGVHPSTFFEDEVSDTQKDGSPEQSA